MKAVAVFPRSREVKLVDVEEPRITQPTQVKLQILEVGVCDVDATICAFKHGTSPADEDYLIIGHEAVASVIEVGSRVNSVMPGDLVVPTVRRPCIHPDCRPCRTGNPDFCVSGAFAECGIKQHHGFLSEYVVEEEKYLQIVPHALREVAVLVEPLTISEKALLQGWHVLQRLPWMANGRLSEGSARGLRSLVVGNGTAAVLGALPLLRAGFETYVYSRTPLPSAMSRTLEVFGAKHLSPNANTSVSLEALRGKVDVICDNSEDREDTAELLHLLAPSGICLLAGNSVDSEQLSNGPEWGIRDMVLKNQVVLRVANAGKNAYPAAVRDLDGFAERWRKEIRSLIALRYPINDYREALLGSAAGAKDKKSVISLDRKAAA